MSPFYWGICWPSFSFPDCLSIVGIACISWDALRAVPLILSINSSFSLPDISTSSSRITKESSKTSSTDSYSVITAFTSSVSCDIDSPSTATTSLSISSLTSTPLDSSLLHWVQSPLEKFLTMARASPSFVGHLPSPLHPSVTPFLVLSQSQPSSHYVSLTSFNLSESSSGHRPVLPV